MEGNVAKEIRDYWAAELPKARRRAAERYLDEVLITDIVGPRRAGKTYFMFDIIARLLKDVPKEATVYLNFENRRLQPASQEHLNELMDFLQAEGLVERFGKIYVFLDEVQRVPRWEQILRSAYDEMKGRVKFFVSGSSSELLAGEYASLLTGRHLTTTVLPLGFREFLEFKGLPTSAEDARMSNAFDEYLTYGGFPEAVQSPNKKAVLSQLFNDLAYRDVFPKTGAGPEAEELLYYLASNFSNLTSFGKMSRHFKSTGIDVSTPTLIKHFKAMKSAFLFFDSTIFSYKARDAMQYPRKIYCIDNGLLDSDGDIGRRLENCIAVELLRRGERLRYWKSAAGHEVDFVPRKGAPIQACLDPASEREVRALVACMAELRRPEGLVLTARREGQERVGGKRVRYVPAWKWMLG